MNKNDKRTKYGVLDPEGQSSILVITDHIPFLIHGDNHVNYYHFCAKQLCLTFVHIWQTNNVITDKLWFPSIKLHVSTRKYNYYKIKIMKITIVIFFSLLKWFLWGKEINKKEREKKLCEVK